MKLQKIYKKYIIFVLLLSFLINFSNAQTRVDVLDLSYWVLSGGIGVNDILVDGASFGFLLDPRLSLTQNLMIGSKNGINFSTDGIIALETQLFLRWKFFQLDIQNKTIPVFIQGGAGFLGALKGPYKHYDIRDSRSSLLGDITAGVTIPVNSRWFIEPSFRVGYPFISGFSITAGYKFPIPKGTEHIEVIREISASEVIRRIMISQVEYIIFGPDISRFNVGIDADARSLNEMVINHIVQVLRENPNYLIRIEGHANPVTHEQSEIEELTALSAARANEVARILRSRGIRNEQMVVVVHGGTRVLATDHDHWNMNRRVELIIIQVDIE